MFGGSTEAVVGTVSQLIRSQTEEGRGIRILDVGVGFVLLGERLFDVLAHLDFIKVSRQVPRAHPSRAVEDALDAIAQAGMAVELNVVGLKAPCCGMFPSDGILDACLQRSIPIMLATDAHEIEGMVDGIERAQRKLLRRGCTPTVGFSRRARYLIPICR